MLRIYNDRHHKEPVRHKNTETENSNFFLQTLRGKYCQPNFYADNSTSGQQRFVLTIDRILFLSVTNMGQHFSHAIFSKQLNFTLTVKIVTAAN